ncbi:helix-turn-helix domain-containing protein [Amycolatopsis sp. BJA-103]|uniref:helix-turn-helix domain-containing protein n=1 Tax=Amycolatopsis sp. BJA-103 TaxID=1911175 RepID=UPI000CAA880A|nr:helix-turn-helix domain-containing protein [Amycolatopsis sp. BJA-103]PNE20905.1 hypothetical protein B1H26_03475 [Amycolatopsis sp. BJA-103]
MSKPAKRSFSFEFKLGVVQRFLAGATELDLAREFGLSSPKLIEAWVRTYRDEGEDGLRPKRRGRPPKPDAQGASGETELEILRRENERLRAETPIWKIACPEDAGTAAKVEQAPGKSHRAPRAARSRVADREEDRAQADA